jgi:hypothetical protein
MNMTKTGDQVNGRSAESGIVPTIGSLGFALARRG